MQLTDDEIAELNNAVTRDRERSEELRARLVQRPVVAGTAEFVAGILDGTRTPTRQRPSSSGRPRPATRELGRS